jgi:hypothetical protein
LENRFVLGDTVLGLMAPSTVFGASTLAARTGLAATLEVDLAGNTVDLSETLVTDCITRNRAAATSRHTPTLCQIVQDRDTDVEVTQAPPGHLAEHDSSRRVGGVFGTHLSMRNSEFRIQNSEFSAGRVGGVFGTHPALGAHDPVLSYSTYLGGTNYDYGFDIAVDSFGSAYVTGEASTAFPLMNPIQQIGGGKDAFVSKFSPDGSSLIYSTYIGGSYFDSADSIAVDVLGGAYITGVTQSGDFPSTAGAFQPENGDENCTGQSSCADAFVTRISPMGTSLSYSTYLGTNYQEAGEGIAVDNTGNAYVMGKTNSPTFYTLNAV